MGQVISAAVLAALSQGDVEPIVVVGFDNPNLYRASLTVSEWQTAAGGGQTIVLGRYLKSDITLAEGTDFDAETSNIVTAANIETALKAALSGSTDTYVYREDGTNEVHVVYAGPIVYFTSNPVGIEENPPRGSFYRSFSSGSSVGGAIAKSVLEVKTAEIRLDPVSRESSIGSCDIVLADDSVIRRMFSMFYITNAKVRIYLGAEGVSTTHLLMTMRLVDYHFESGSIRLGLSTFASLLDDRQVDGRVCTRHPYDAIKEISIRAGLTDGVAFDFDSLELSTLPNDQHAYCVARANQWHASFHYQYYDDGLGETVDNGNKTVYTHQAGGNVASSAWDYIQEINIAFGQTIYTDLATGVSKAKRYRLDADIDHTFRPGDYTQFRHVSSTDNTINSVNVEIGNKPIVFTRSDDKAINIQAGGEDTPRALYTINSPYLNAIATFSRVYDGTEFYDEAWAPSDLSGDQWILVRTAGGGFSCGHMVQSGSAWVYELSSHQTATTGLEHGVVICRVDTFESSPTYNDDGSLSGIDGSQTPRNTEYIAFTPNELNAGNNAAGIGADQVEGDQRLGSSINRPTHTYFSVATSFNDLGFTDGRLGFESATVSDGESYLYAYVTDCSLALRLADSILERFAFGAPVVQFTLPLHYAGMEIGDTFTIIGEDRFVWFQHTDTTGIVFEVTEVSHNLAGESPGVRIEGTYLRSANILEIFINDDNPSDVPNPATQWVLTDNDGDLVWWDSDSDGTEDTQVIAEGL